MATKVSFPWCAAHEIFGFSKKTLKTQEGLNLQLYNTYLKFISIKNYYGAIFYVLAIVV